MNEDRSVLWMPSPDDMHSSNCAQYLLWLRQSRGKVFDSYHDLWEWSTSDLEGFWSSMWEYFDISSFKEPSRVLASRSMPGAQWFPGSRLNYAQNMLRRSEFNGAAVIGKSQTRPDMRLTIDELKELVGRCRQGLRRLGVGRGDRVVAYLPNIPETLAVFLATASLGAVWSSCAPEFGSRSVIDRFKQVEPKVLIAINGYRYGDSSISRVPEVARIRDALPTLEAIVVLDYLQDVPGDPLGLGWSEFTSHESELSFEPVPFDHPLYVLYSSGTTGLPKAIVHSHGGILIEHLKFLAIHVDLRPGDRFFWYTTTGWMMWNLLISGLLHGSTVVLFDGNPNWPHSNHLWELIGSEELTYFGVSAPFLTAASHSDPRLSELTALSTLRGIGATGAPLPPATARWLYEQLPPSVQLGTPSGGTDVCTGFVGPVPILPVRADEIPCRCLGAKVEVFDREGNSVIEEVGELVITEPMPSMPVGLWGDDGDRYHRTYFSTYPGVWKHGDWAELTEHRGCVISGRSDATLNRGGIRMGTSEFYETIEPLPWIEDSLVVHIPDPDGGPGELIVFVVPVGDQLSKEAIADGIRQKVRVELSPRHVPDEIELVPAIPRTLTGKKLEIPMKEVLMGKDPELVASAGSLANPDAISAFVEYAKRRSARG